ncbi:MAG: methyltransferase domain-containing protein [Acidimicrobiia bacterium]|nr:methyltransferase domain-containing protein [Acidimicrobiia bacterium]
MSELFDEVESYDDMLQRGLSLSGESKEFFIRGRLEHLRRRLGDRRVTEREAPTRILDFGCGVGDGAGVLAEAFPGASVVGVDVAEAAVQKANATRSSERVAFGTPVLLDGAEPFDLCYVNGAFHHIAADERAQVMRTLYAALRPGGVLAVFENNPWSIPARLVMRRIPFDADAAMLRPAEVARLARNAGFTDVLRPRYLFVFPRALRSLRGLENALAAAPIGAQYAVLCVH